MNHNHGIAYTIAALDDLNKTKALTRSEAPLVIEGDVVEAEIVEEQNTN